MYARLAFAALVCTIGLNAPAQADIYAAGPVYGGNPTGGVVTCRVLNVGTTAVSITLRQIITNTNAVLPPTSDTCAAALAPGLNCAVTRAAVPGNFALSCRMFVTGVDPHISGSIDVQNPVGTVRVVESLQAQ
jgi:hypothetical protein